jgi:hypothetical protein
MVWMTLAGMRSDALKHSDAMAVESRKVPLEIFFNPTILSDDNLVLGFSDFFTRSAKLRVILGDGKRKAHLNFAEWAFFS